MTDDGRPPPLQIRQEFFVPTIVHDINETVPQREMAISINKSKNETVKDALAAHKTLTDLLYDFLPTEMQISFQDNNEFPVIAKMLTDVEAKHGTMPEEVRLLLQSQLLTPLGHDEDPGPY